MIRGAIFVFLIFSVGLSDISAEKDEEKGGKNPGFTFLTKNNYKGVNKIPKGTYTGTTNTPDVEEELNEEGPNSRPELNKWTNAQLYYAIDNGARSGLKFTNQDLNYIAGAFCRIELYTCIRFLPYVSATSSPNYTFIQRDNDYCNSALGMVGGEQVLRLMNSDASGSTCFENPGVGSHELLHALGYDHEQQRYDRNEYITYDSSNVPAASQHNFDRSLPASINYDGRYDYFSIMQYDRKAFAADQTKDTMTPTDPNVATLGNRQGLTKRDVDKVNSYYCCTQDAQGQWLANGRPVVKTMCPPACPTSKTCTLYYAPYGSQERTLQVFYNNMSTCDENLGKYCKGSTEDFCVLLGKECPNTNAACCPLQKVCTVQNNTIQQCYEDSSLMGTCKYDPNFQRNTCQRCLVKGEVCKYINDCCGTLMCQKYSNEANFTCKMPS